MIKLLIVDDEPLVQVGIKSMIDWADYGIEICGTAMNGEMALKLIEEYSPEIVITDIKMPIMNGLELAKICRDTYGPIPLFLILTSYEEFQLVREALSYQVFEYLIKLELDPQTLGQTVERVLDRLTELQATAAYKQEGQQPLLENYRDKFFMRLLYNLFDSREQFEIQAKELKQEFSDRCYLAAHGELHSAKTATMTAAQQEKLYSSSLQMIQEILGKHFPSYVIPLDKRHFAVIFHFTDLVSDIRPVIEPAWNNVCTMVHNYFSVHLTVGIGDMAEDPLRINESYQEARQAFNLADAESPPHLRSAESVESAEHSLAFFAGISGDNFHNTFNLAVFKNAITQAFEEFDTDVLYDTLTQITELFSTYPPHVLQAVDGACNILYLSLSLLPEGEETLEQIFSEYSDGYRSIYRMKTVEQVISWLSQLRDGLCRTLKSSRKTYKDHVIINVQKYINNHMEERLSLNEVADVFGLSANYLSALFKKTCNIGFSEYITQKKVTRAKALLLEENMKIYEVADKLGFESAFYFSKVFKKVEGISPREFIQAHLASPEEYQD